MLYVSSKDLYFCILKKLKSKKIIDNKYIEYQYYNENTYATFVTKINDDIRDVFCDAKYYNTNKDSILNEYYIYNLVPTNIKNKYVSKYTLKEITKKFNNQTKEQYIKTLKKPGN